MFIRAPDSHSRSLVKAVSWRLLGSIDTFCISFFVTGHLTAAASIASVESVTKIILFYLHERAWTSVAWGRGKAEPAAAEGPDEAAEAPALAST